MKIRPHSRRGLTLIELMITTVLISALGLIIFSILSIGISLGAKNTAVNTAHQQARRAMAQMTQTLHGAVSLPQLIDADLNPIPSPTPGPTPISAAGISFQVWAGGPYRITNDTTNAWTGIQANVTGKPFTGGTAPLNQRLIIPGYQIEADIKKTPSTTGTITLVPLATPSPAPEAVPIKGTGAPSNNNVTCFVTSRCYYLVRPSPSDPEHGTLEYHYTDAATGQPVVVTLATRVGSTPFSLSGNNVTVQLATEDSTYSNQQKRAENDGFKSTKILLTETIPVRSQLTLQP